jgi:hypothetical protein
MNALIASMFTMNDKAARYVRANSSAREFQAARSPVLADAALGRGGGPGTRDGKGGNRIGWLALHQSRLTMMCDMPCATTDSTHSIQGRAGLCHSMIR